MSTSNICLWTTLALCVALGGCDVFYKQEGEEVIMHCGDADLDQGFKWKHNEALLVGVSKSGVPSKGTSDLAQRAKLNKGMLKIPSVKTIDAGVYKCTGNDRKTIQEHRLQIVTVSVSPSDTVLSSTEVTLRCDVSDPSSVQFQWMKPPGAESYGSPGENVLTLKSVTSADDGMWTCNITENEKVVKTIVVRLSVAGPLKSQEEVTAPPGGAVELPCFLPSPIPLTIVEGGWKRDPHTDLKFPTLNRDDGGLRWNGTQSRVEFSSETLSTDFSVKLNDVQPSDAGVYVCTLKFKDGQRLNATLNLKVVTGAPVPPPDRPVVTAPLGGAADLPCVHSGSGNLRVVGGKWLRKPPTDTPLLTLTTAGDGRHWNTTDALKYKVEFSDQQPSSSFTLSLNKVEPADAGVYVCSLTFNDGSDWSSEVELKVEEEEAKVSKGVRPPPETGGFWEKPLFLGLALWIWVAVAAGSLLLVVLVMVTVLVQCRTKRKRRRAEKNKVHMPSSRELVAMQTECPAQKTGRQPRSGMKDRPLPPVPKHQYKQII
ncbi:CD4-2 molecule, tandem duplicate 2 isoform X1 [Astyanax mexicanus]|uniref:CD4-2 molecule, tandem duplicate 2 isoform X1 n=1 Tax=Astyanax mexicanus TaxID=7994 RepID=UPI0020CAB482|nr:CD4-2 molecule, tandem duplicate 2 isoform X1 [Astyanax mexicanus]